MTQVKIGKAKVTKVTPVIKGKLVETSKPTFHKMEMDGKQITVKMVMAEFVPTKN